MSLTKKPELLAPAGSMESLKAAVNNGCDAIYLGGKAYSARQSADNFSIEEIEEACDYCHLRGVKIYVTVNTLYKDSELKEFLEYVGQLYKVGVDALIIQDLGAIQLVKENFPEFPLHASTQMTVNSLEDVKYWAEQGVSKVVLSRELSLDEISEITQNTDVEIETFIHGALCVCYSGQCIMSSMLGGRSGNRGRCAQTCRLPYTLYKGPKELDEGYLLSPKDMQTLSILPKLIEAGISSLKIEGRMKKPEYVAGVTAIYRKYIDMYFENPNQYEVSLEDMKILTQLFNRGGFTEGYYTQVAGKEMLSVERPKTWGLKVGFVESYIPKYNRLTIRTREALVPGDGIEIWTAKGPNVGTSISKASKAGEVIAISMEGQFEKNDMVYRTYGKALNDTLKKTWEKDTKKLPIAGQLRAVKGEPLSLTIWDFEGSRASVTGDIVEKAENQGTPIEKIKQQIGKMGATSFVLETLEAEIDDDIFASVGALNQLRREAVEALEAEILAKTKHAEIETKRTVKPQQPYVSRKVVEVLVANFEQLEAAVRVQGIDAVYYEVSDSTIHSFETALKLCQKYEVKLYAALPQIARQWRADKDFILFSRLQALDIDGYLVRTAGQFAEVKNSGKTIIIDYTLNVMNADGVRFWKEQGADRVCLSVETNLQEINKIGDKDCQMVVYGYLPLMKTQQCPVGNFVGGKNGSLYCSERGKHDLYFLKDRKDMKFPLDMDCDNCVCTILNSKPLFTLKFYGEILESVTGYVRLDFTKEGPARTSKITKAYAEMTEDPKTVSQETKHVLSDMEEKGNTKGHYFRGVE